MDIQLWGIILLPYIALLGLIIWDASRDSTRDAKLVIESLLTTLLIVLTIGQLTVAQRQAAIMEKQTEIAAAQTRIASTDQRPWIRPTLAEVRDIVIDDKLISLGIDFRFKNSGKSPAVRVSVAHGWSPQNKDHRSDQYEFCKMAEISMGDASPTIYPKEDADYTFGTAYSGPATSMNTPWGNGPELYVVPEIYGCVAYKTAMDEVVHHSRFAFAMRKRDGNGVRLIPSIGPQTIKGADIVMRYSPFGYNDAD